MRHAALTAHASRRRWGLGVVFKAPGFAATSDVMRLAGDRMTFWKPRRHEVGGARGRRAGATSRARLRVWGLKPATAAFLEPSREAGRRVGKK